MPRSPTIGAIIAAVYAFHAGHGRNSSERDARSVRQTAASGQVRGPLGLLDDPPTLVVIAPTGVLATQSRRRIARPAAGLNQELWVRAAGQPEASSPPLTAHAASTSSNSTSVGGPPHRQHTSMPASRPLAAERPSAAQRRAPGGPQPQLPSSAPYPRGCSRRAATPHLDRECGWPARPLHADRAENRSAPRPGAAAGRQLVDSAPASAAPCRALEQLSEVSSWASRVRALRPGDSPFDVVGVFAGQRAQLGAPLVDLLQPGRVGVQ